jgi:chorismate mutase
MAGKQKTKAQKIQSDTQLMNGMQKNFPSTTFTIQSGQQTTAQVATVLTARINAAQAVLTAKAAYHSAVVAYEQEEEQTEPLVQGIRQTILTMYSASPQILSDCGVSARKANTPLTAQQKVVAAAKAKATRAARGTMTAKEKAAIKGTVPATVVINTDGSSASPTPPATPPAAPATTNGSSTPHS